MAYGSAICWTTHAKPSPWSKARRAWILTQTLALVRLLEIIGEAAGRISKADRDRYSNIPWAEIVGLRNRLIHGYDEVDLDILWEIVTADLTPLIKNLENLLEAKR